jgi:hypothetical protein
MNQGVTKMRAARALCVDCAAAILLFENIS